MSVLDFTGFETGDGLPYTGGVGSGQSVQGSIVRTGAYALKALSSATGITRLITGLSTTTLYARIPLYIEDSTAPGSDQSGAIAVFYAGATNVCYLARRHLTTGVHRLYLWNQVAGAGTTSYQVLPGQWYVVEVKVVISATVGILELKIDGVVKETLSSQNTGSSALTEVQADGALFGTPASLSNCYFDDVLFRDDAYPGDGRSIARQGKAGTPTYDTWTKTSSQTAAQVWSETPYSATNNAAFTGATAAAQTMLADDISAGTNPIGSGDVINAVRMAMIAKTSGVASAITITWKAAIYSTTAATSYATTGTYTPKSHALLVVFVVTTLGATPLDPTTVTGHGVSFAKLTLSARTLSTTHAVSVWVADSGASPTTAAVTASYGAVSQTGGVVIEFEVEGADMSTSATAAIVQNPTNTAASGTAETVTLAAAGNSNNRALIFGVHLSNTAQTAAGAWTLTAGAAGNFNTPPTGGIGLFNNSSFDTAGAATGANVAWRMVGLEIKCDLTSGGKLSLRRRIAAADTDEAVTLTTSDAFYASSIFTDTRANLIAAEIGAIKQISYQSRTHTVEDGWLMVDYTPAAGRASKNTRAFPLGVDIGMGWRL